MTIYERSKNIVWNLDKIRFLYPPDDFTGAFTNEKMQSRHKAMQDQKIRNLLDQLEIKENPIEAMCVLNPLEHIRFLLNNIELFKKKNSLEEAFIYLYYRKNTPFVAVGDYEVWKLILSNCDPEKLYNQGSPFPQGKVTAYRGSVTGIPRGLSWTISPEKAAWILDRWKDKDLGGGTVFATEITREDILFYIKDDIRQEVILVPCVAEKIESREITSL